MQSRCRLQQQPLASPFLPGATRYTLTFKPR